MNIPRSTKLREYDKEISKHQKSYRDRANRKLHNIQDVRKRMILESGINRCKKELEEVNSSIGVAENRAIRIEFKRSVDKIEKYFAEEQQIDNEINTIQTNMGHLKSQISRVDKEYMDLGRKAISDDAYAEKLRAAQKAIEILENELDYTKKKKNALKLHNQILRHSIDELRYARHLFQEQWVNVVGRLFANKKQIIEMVDQVMKAFERGTQIFTRIEVSKAKAITETQNRRKEMQQTDRVKEAKDRSMNFFKEKAKIATINDVDAKFVALREKTKFSHQKLTDAYKSHIENVRSIINVNGIDDIVGKLTEYKRNYFQNYLYLNEINKNLTALDVAVENTRAFTALVERQLKRPAEKQNELDALKSKLSDQKDKTRQCNKKRKAMQTNLTKYYSSIQEMYEILMKTSIATKSREQIIEGETNEFNVEKILSAIEQQLKHIMINVFCWQRDTNQNPDDWLVRGIEFINITRPKIEVDPIVHPCPECSQNDDSSNPEKELPLNRDELLDKLKKQITTTNIESRMHNIQECPATRSRVLLGAWV